jgi:hypothetical protein
LEAADDLWDGIGGAGGGAAKFMIGLDLGAGGDGVRVIFISATLFVVDLPRADNLHSVAGPDFNLALGGVSASHGLIHIFEHLSDENAVGPRAVIVNGVREIQAEGSHGLGVLREGDRAPLACSVLDAGLQRRRAAKKSALGKREGARVGFCRDDCARQAGVARGR